MAIAFADIDPSIDAYLERVARQPAKIDYSTPMIHARLTHVEASSDNSGGDLTLCSGDGEIVTVFTGNPALSRDLVVAMNEVLARHAYRPTIMRQLRASIAEIV